MSWTLTIDQNANCVVIVHDGFPQVEEIIHLLGSVVDHPSHISGMPILSDLRAVEMPDDVDFGWLIKNNSIHGVFDQRLGPCKNGLVYGNAVGLGVGNQFSRLTSNTMVERRAFMDMHEAKRWLGLPDDYRLDLVPNDWALPAASRFRPTNMP